MKVHKGYKFRLEPTEEQKVKINKTLGCCRFVYNSILDRRIKAYKRRGENMSYIDTQWCCTIKVDIENSKGQYIEKDKQEATKDGLRKNTIKRWRSSPRQSWKGNCRSFCLKLRVMRSLKSKNWNSVRKYIKE